MQKIQILLINTDRDSQVILQELIRDLGFSTHVETDVGRALQKMEQEEFAVVIMDNQLDGYSGLDVLKRLKKDHPLTEVIVVPLCFALFNLAFLLVVSFGTSIVVYQVARLLGWGV